MMTCCSWEIINDNKFRMSLSKLTAEDIEGLTAEHIEELTAEHIVGLFRRFPRPTGRKSPSKWFRSGRGGTTITWEDLKIDNVFPSPPDGIVIKVHRMKGRMIAIFGDHPEPDFVLTEKYLEYMLSAADEHFNGVAKSYYSEELQIGSSKVNVYGIRKEGIDRAWKLLEPTMKQFLEETQLSLTPDVKKKIVSLISIVFVEDDVPEGAFYSPVHPPPSSTVCRVMDSWFSDLFIEPCPCSC